MTNEARDDLLTYDDIVETDETTDQRLLVEIEGRGDVKRRMSDEE